MLVANYNSIRFLLAAAFVLTTTLNCGVAQSKPPDEYPRFEAIDLGTFGGPNASISAFAQIISERGTVTSAADTSTITSCTSTLNYPGDCNALHAFSWRDGTLTDLGTLGGDDSYGFWINEQDDIAGVAENGVIDPVTGHPNQHAALWHDGTIADLGTFGGAQSFAFAINNRGQVAGAASTAVPDQFSLDFIYGGFFPTNQETHAFLWDRGTLHDLGTLGGPGISIFYQ
jgi:probable HAF family extracellular repeat protein